MKITTEQELVDAIRGAAGPLSLRGGGTRDIGRPATGEGMEVALSGVELYEPGALTLVVRAGTPLAEIEALLAGEGQRLAFEPMDHRVLLGTTGVPTIGGVVAANVSGPRRVQAGAARDFALGVRFVDGTGRLIRNGGRVMKNVTGYDLVKLMSGSWGTLGVLSEVALKVLPAPEAEATLSLAAAGPAEAVVAMSAALGTPFDVTGAAWDGALVRVRIEGQGASVTYRAGALAERLGRFGAVTVEADRDASRALWRAIRDVDALADAPVVWRASVRPSQAPGLVAAVTAAGFAPRVQLDWGGGLVWLAVAAEAGEVIRGALAGGHATLVKAPLDARARIAVFQPEPAPVAALSAGLKQKFDPRGILNPGRMG